MTEINAHEIEQVDVAVVGGGLAGLAAAATAAQAERSVIVLDGRPLGGRARVDRRGEFLFNQGPRALYLDGPGRRVLDKLGVPTDAGGEPLLKGSQALFGTRLHLLPQGPTSLMRTSMLSAGEKVRVAKLLATLPGFDPESFAGISADEMIASFDLGPVGSQLVTGVVRVATYTAATDVIDAPTALTQVLYAVGAGVVYLDGGWQTLVDALAARAAASGASMRSGLGVRLVTEHEGSPLVLTQGGGRISARAVVLAPGGPDAVSRLLGGRPSVWPTLGPPATAACLELGLRRPPETRFVLGVDTPLYLSTHCPPADLAPPGGVVVHLMRYQRHDDDRTSTTIRNELWRLAQMAGITDDDVVEQRFLSNMVVTGALPAAATGGRPGRPTVEATGRPGVLMAGDWVGEEGLLSDTALASGAAAGRLAVERSATLEVV
jgi:phytoene dehydrogenase-like protein